MKRIITAILCCLLMAFLNAQTVALTFTGRIANSQYVPLNRVVVSNLTKGWQETLMWPDTVLVMTPTGVEDMETLGRASLQMSQNNPNPFDGTTFVNLQVAEQGDVTIEITDITGRIVWTNNLSIQQGVHKIRISIASAGVYFLTARQNGRMVSVKMLNRGNGGGNAVTVAGIVEMSHETSPQQTKIAHKGATDNPFDPGDQMEYVGFATHNGVEVESGHVIQLQNASQTVVLSFAQTCAGIPTLTDIDGNVYNTIQIGSQCWMKENLRAKMFADSTPIPAGTNYSTTEAYYDDSTSIIPLEERGYLYNWLGAMHGAAASSAVPSGVQGVCPSGWHLPSDAEWTILTNYLSSHPGYACGGNMNYIAKALASTSWWVSSPGECHPGNQSVTNNASNFTIVPTGSYWSYGYDDTGMYASFWTSTENASYNDYAYFFGIDFDREEVSLPNSGKNRRFSVRCLRNE